MFTFKFHSIVTFNQQDLSEGVAHQKQHCSENKTNTEFANELTEYVQRAAWPYWGRSV